MARFAMVIAAFLFAVVASGSINLEALQAGQAAPPVRARAAQTAAAPAAKAAAPPASAMGNAEQYQAVLDQYCATCHNQRTKMAGVMFDQVKLADLAGHADIWEKTLRKVRAGMMPPPGARRPDATTMTTFASWLEMSLDHEAALNPDPGRVPLHRLNRAEYANAIDDLLGVRVDASALLPKDDEADGFDNVAAALRVSPSFLDQYISAARFVTLRALGAPGSKPGSTTFRPPRGTDQFRRAEGMPPGTRGGFMIDHLFPADGEYKFNISGLANAFYMRNMEYEHTVILTIDGVKIFQDEVGGEEDLKFIDQKQAPAVAAVAGRFQNITATVKAGPHKVGVGFIQRAYVESDDVLRSLRPGAGEDRLSRIGSVEIVGPFNETGISDTPSRAKVFVCRPAAGASEADETACAKTILTNMARLAFRRPVTDNEVAAALSFYQEARREENFEAGIRNALPAILASPKFLFRADHVPEGVAAGAVYRINDFELASRLAFFLTGRNPDDELLDVATAGKLDDPVVLDKQVKRLLADPRSKTLVTNFAFQWLKLRALDDIEPDTLQFPNFDQSLRESFKKEVELFIQALIREDRSALDFMTGNYTYLNERLALHYGVKNVRGETFQRVTLQDPNRFGILGKGAVLMATSYANRTAPVIRGAWILENILGTPPASPPPDVEGFQENRVGEKNRTVRQILEEHRTKPTCHACHAVMDPIGFSLENFDAVGAWRTKDRFANEVIDPTGELVDGTKVSGPVDLRKALLKRPEQFVQTLTEKLMVYGLGRGVEAHDMPAIRKIVRDAATDNYRFSSLVLGIVKSAPFQMRKSSPGASELRSTAE